MTSASVVNELVDGINALLALRGVGSVIVTPADAGYTVSLTPEAQEKMDDLIDGNIGGGGSLDFRGEWATGQDYVVGSVVTRLAVALDDDAMEAGTFYCREAHTSSSGNAPPSGNTTQNTHWTMLARSRFNHLWVKDSTDTTIGYTHLYGGDLKIDFGSRTADGLGTTTKLILDSTLFGSGTIDPDLKGKTFQPRKVEICEGGVLKHMFVLATETF